MESGAYNLLELRIVLPQLSAHAGNQAAVFTCKLISHAREFPQHYYVRFHWPQATEVADVGAKGVGEHAGVTAVILRSRGGEAVSKTIKLPQI